MFLFSYFFSYNDGLRIQCILSLLKYKHNFISNLSHPVSIRPLQRRQFLFSKLMTRGLSWKKTKFLCIQFFLQPFFFFPHCNLERHPQSQVDPDSHLGPQPPFVILYVGTFPRITLRPFTWFMMCLWLYFLMSLAMGPSQRMKISFSG